MGDPLFFSQRKKDMDVPSLAIDKKAPERGLVSSSPKDFFQKRFKHITSLDHVKLGNGTVGHVAFFLLKVTALEVVRRFSNAKCPVLWRGLGALQLLCCPPFKWIQRWSFFRGFVKGIQALSRPFLLVSLATALCDRLEDREKSNDHDGSQACSEPDSEQSTTDTGMYNLAPESLPSESWLIRLHKELEQQGITLPVRINEDELQRFYTAANGDFSSFLSSIKKSIHWRETYHILSEEDLELWSRLVFWHGYDVKLRPCLVIRLGLACSTLASHDRPRFAQAVVSQVDHGVLHLVNQEAPQITVLMDCEGLSALKFPMQMMRYCSAVLQENYPNRLACLFVIRLPPVVRVIAQTSIQILKPVTRQKVRIEGDTYQKVLFEFLTIVPSFLGGKCTCARCSTDRIGDTWSNADEETDDRESYRISAGGENRSLVDAPYETELQFDGYCQQVIRTAIISMLMLFIFVALIAGMYDPENHMLSF